jgi:hypothetical protein
VAKAPDVQLYPIAPCDACKKSIDNVIASKNPKATAVICYKCVSKSLMGKFKCYDKVRRPDKLGETPYNALDTDPDNPNAEEAAEKRRRIGWISFFQHPHQCRHTRHSYGVQFDQPGGEGGCTVLEEDLVLVDDVQPVTLIIEGATWLMPLSYDSKQAALDTIAEIELGTFEHDHAAPPLRARVVDKSFNILESRSF